MIAGLRRLAVLSLVAVATRAVAQEQAALPACEDADPEAAPCRAHYDTAPVLALGLKARIGSIAAGKAADIIAVNGDPLANVRELESVDFVMKGGTVYKEAR